MEEREDNYPTEIGISPALVRQLADPAGTSRVPKDAIFMLARCCTTTRARDLNRAKKKLLARVGRCKFAIETYIEAKAALQGKAVVYVSNGVPVADVPIE